MKLDGKCKIIHSVLNKLKMNSCEKFEISLKEHFEIY